MNLWNRFSEPPYARSPKPICLRQFATSYATQHLLSMYFKGLSQQPHQASAFHLLLDAMTAVLRSPHPGKISQAPVPTPGPRMPHTAAPPPPPRALNETPRSLPSRARRREAAATAAAAAAARAAPSAKRLPSPHANPGRRGHATPPPPLPARRGVAMRGRADRIGRAPSPPYSPHSPRHRLPGHGRRVPFDIHLRLLRRRRHDTGPADLARRSGKRGAAAHAPPPSVKLRPEEKPGRRRERWRWGRRGALGGQLRAEPGAEGRLPGDEGRVKG